MGNLQSSIQLLGLLTCNGGILVAVSSYFMWRKRKTQGKLGAPGKPKEAGDDRRSAHHARAWGVDAVGRLVDYRHSGARSVSHSSDRSVENGFSS